MGYPLVDRPNVGMGAQGKFGEERYHEGWTYDGKFWDPEGSCATNEEGFVVISGGKPLYEVNIML